MKREEPATRLVDPFGDEVSGVDVACVEGLLILERVMDLCVRHGAGVEPYVDEVRLALHRAAGRGDEYDVVHVRAMQVDAVVILGRVGLGHEAVVFIGIALHEARFDGAFDLGVEFADRADTLLFRVVIRAPNGQRRAPIATAAQVPVLQVLEPFAEATRASALWLPVDRIVELDHAIAAGGGADKPAVKRIVKDGLIGAPAVRIVVHVFLDLESQPLLLEHDTEVDVERILVVGVGEGGIVIVLHVAPCVFLI